MPWHRNVSAEVHMAGLGEYDGGMDDRQRGLFEFARHAEAVPGHEEGFGWVFSGLWYLNMVQTLDQPTISRQQIPEVPCSVAIDTVHGF